MNPKLDLPALDQWLSERGESPREQLHAPDGARFAATFARLYWPDFVEVEGCVLFREAYEPANFESWWTTLAGDRSRIESMINHVHLWDLFDEEELPEDVIEDIARVLEATWTSALQSRFPDRDFHVDLVDEYGPTLYVSTQRPWCYYGFRGMNLESARALVEKTLGVALESHESQYLGGVCFWLSEAESALILRPNLETWTGTALFSEEEAEVLLYLSGGRVDRAADSLARLDSAVVVRRESA